MVECNLQYTPVGFPQGTEQRLARGTGLGRKHQPASGGKHEERQHGPSAYRGTDGNRHRPEHSSLQSLQCQDRDVDGQNDDDARQYRRADFMHGVAHRGEHVHRSRRPNPPLIQNSHAVVHDDDRTIDDDPEVDRAQTH